MQYTQSAIEQITNRIGVLMINLGTPVNPSSSAVRQYLDEFLSDPRVIEKPRLLWWMILHFVILRVRPSKSAKAYQKIWTKHGSPLLHISQQQQLKLQNTVDETITVELAMRYSQPSIKSALVKLQAAGISKLLVLPMYPQYCASTTASCFDSVSSYLQSQRWIPETRFINDYYAREDYINALAASVTDSWKEYGKGALLVISYHGIPLSYIDKGDPYRQHCEATTTQLQAALGLSDDQIMTVFQSRVGREKWLEPYCDKTLSELPAKGYDNIDIMSPAFSADCLETLEELDMENRDIFMQAGGKRYHYIPALNDRDDHIQALANLINDHTQGWIK